MIAQHSALATPVGDLSLRQMTVCLVDDDPDQVVIIQKMLEPSGCRICSFHSGAEALAWLEKSPADLVLADVMMPGLDGWELHARLREHGPNKTTPFIFITCVISPSQEGLMSDSTAGTLSLAKPVSRQRLLRAIRQVLC